MLAVVAMIAIDFDKRLWYQKGIALQMEEERRDFASSFCPQDLMVLQV